MIIDEQNGLTFFHQSSSKPHNIVMKFIIRILVWKAVCHIPKVGRCNLYQAQPGKFSFPFVSFLLGFWGVCVSV